ncbi:glycosyltransferase family 4 protein [Sphingomonas mesophila]|uniref:glycosyltransferase family 4 protein n=1 Tax=Sphingomonas mesophila TaxID=2303576 RepID=UPI0013C30F63|nr:glycosyltransferase family 4 protein [Sphingomonas mesophila]
MMLSRSPVQRVINIGELVPKSDEFVELPTGVQRVDFSGLPESTLERLVIKPRLSRYRAAVEAAWAAKDAALISHLPAMTAAVSLACRAFHRTPPHLAFSFNFTELPVGRRRDYFQAALKEVTQFCVFSEFERKLYSDHFNLDLARIKRINWTQHPPRPSDHPAPLARRSYVAAVGGEGRDYATLLKAAKLLPGIPFLIVARPHNIAGDLPPNVRFMCNLPLEQTWRIAVDSTTMVVPLKSRTTCCGHITLVGSQLLGLPVVTTESEATREYTESPSVAQCAPGDFTALAGLIEKRHLNWKADHEVAQDQVASCLVRYDRQQWAALVSDFLKQHSIW